MPFDPVWFAIRGVFRARGNGGMRATSGNAATGENAGEKGRVRSRYGLRVVRPAGDAIDHFASKEMRTLGSSMFRGFDIYRIVPVFSYTFFLFTRISMKIDIVSTGTLLHFPFIFSHTYFLFFLSCI